VEEFKLLEQVKKNESQLIVELREIQQQQLLKKKSPMLT
jgi:hypothetical protein